MKVLSALFLILFTASAFAQEAADPAMAALKRMRDQLRSVMLQQQKTEGERAALAAEKVTLEEKIATQEASFKKLAKESNLQKDADAKEIEGLKAKAAQQEAAIAKLLENNAAWKKSHTEIVDAAKKIEAQRQEYAARVILLDRKVTEADRKNRELYSIGSEVLSKYEGFGLGTAIAAREPFTKTMRVKLEGYIQDFGDKLEDNRVAPDDAPKKAISKEEAAAVQKPAQQ